MCKTETINILLTRLCVVLSVLVIGGCFNAQPPDSSVDNADEVAVSSPNDSISEESQTVMPAHDAEQAALQFIEAVRDDISKIPDIPADAELSIEGRVLALRELERFIESQAWNLWFTYIEVFEGNEDFVDCYFRGADGDLLVLMFEYDFAAQAWAISAYEIPTLTFARPDHESYADYVTRSVAELKADAQPYRDGVVGDGGYFIEY